MQIKKYRKQHQSFLVEGAKSVIELLKSDFEITTLLGTSVFLNENESLLKSKDIEKLTVREQDLVDLGTFQTNNAGLAIAKIKENSDLQLKPDELALALDDIRDPGNLGTIIRIADWYGITKIICSLNCAEVYNPKVINATMGSFTRVDLFYTDLAAYLNMYKGVVYGAFLEGENIHSSVLRENGGLIVMGNESNGISDELAPLIKDKINIPRYGEAESLNVAIATAIICDNFRRKISPSAL